MLLGGGGRPSEAAPPPSPTTPPSRPSIPGTLRPARIGSASSFSTSGDAFFLLPKPRGIVVLQGVQREGMGGGCSGGGWGGGGGLRYDQTNIHLFSCRSVGCLRHSNSMVLQTSLKAVSTRPLNGYRSPHIRAVYIAGSVMSSSLQWMILSWKTETEILSF